jgi:hypothetical protein
MLTLLNNSEIRHCRIGISHDEWRLADSKRAEGVGAVRVDEEPLEIGRAKLMLDHADD